MFHFCSSQQIMCNIFERHWECDIAFINESPPACFINLIIEIINLHYNHNRKYKKNNIEDTDTATPKSFLNVYSIYCCITNHLQLCNLRRRHLFCWQFCNSCGAGRFISSLLVGISWSGWLLALELSADSLTHMSNAICL